MNPRSELLIGERGVQRLQAARVTILGLGGVGSFALEALARSGVGHLRIYDMDHLEQSNLNRQLLALHSTLGEPKAEVARRRVLDINPQCTVEAQQLFYREGELPTMESTDLVLDCIDSFMPKLRLILELQRRHACFASSLGAGGRMDPTRVRLTTLDHTQGDPLAARLRKFLRRHGAPLDFAVAFSDERPVAPAPAAVDTCAADPEQTGRVRPTQASMVFVPAAFGLALAHWATQQILEGTE